MVQGLFGCLGWWEGSAADSRVLRDAIHRPNGLRVPSGILRSQSFHPIDVQNMIIMACCLLDNFIRNEMPDDPFAHKNPTMAENDSERNNDFICTIDSSSTWNAWRDELATSMYNEWLH
ncbi:UNVERIFIED_CONTAM: hypothetical protein Slati_0208400 [Sesamum latifolium]|uniref:Uncharacterized protein n=1 Tax=Sesamum latifolium TaxID=2727402 RepID=A0AAW2YBW9_9LAMI